MWPRTLLLQPRDSSQGFDSPDPRVSMKRVQSRTIQALRNSSQDLSRPDPAQLQRIWASPKYSLPRPRTVEPSTLPYPTTTPILSGQSHFPSLGQSALSYLRRLTSALSHTICPPNCPMRKSLATVPAPPIYQRHMDRMFLSGPFREISGQ